LEYALGSQENLGIITLYFTRLVLGVQLVLAGVQLPSKYLLTEWKSLALLLGPGMTAMWLCSSLIIWGMVPELSFLHSLAIGACVTPTDPVLSNSIVKGKFADKNIPKDLQKIIIAESGANDGLGYPFLFLALYLIKYVGSKGGGQSGGARLAIGDWFGETWGYTICLSVVYGATVGWVAKELLHWAEEKKFVDRESFLVFAITLAVSSFYFELQIRESFPSKARDSSCPVTLVGNVCLASAEPQGRLSNSGLEMWDLEGFLPLLLDVFCQRNVPLLTVDSSLSRVPAV